MWNSPPTLDCDQCGDILRTLTPEEELKVALNPYNYIAYCSYCRKEIWEQLELKEKNEK